MAAIQVRPATQAGRFYPEDPEELRSTLRGMLDLAPKAAGEVPRGLVAPHAGYLFSGPTAASAYRQIEDIGFERIVILAPSHRARFQGASIYGGNAYQTPLGQIPLDLDFIESLRRHHKLFRCVSQAHESEHSIEVQLPFLQMTLSEFRIVPILISDQSETNSLRVADTLIQALETFAPTSTLFVASSDLYHGTDYQSATVSDHRFTETLRSFEPRRLSRAVAGGECMACGAGPIAAAMQLSRHAGATRATVLHRTNSREANPQAGSDYIVGYLAAMFH